MKYAKVENGKVMQEFPSLPDDIVVTGQRLRPVQTGIDKNGDPIMEDQMLPFKDSIKGVRKSFGNVARLKGWGLLPIIEPELVYDPKTHKPGPRTVTVNADDVTITRTAVPRDIHDNWNDWVKEMNRSDKEDMSRIDEDHIEHDHAGLSLSPDLQARYDSKKAKRAKQPPKPPEE